MTADLHPDSLLPWYVNHTLDGVEREQVERHLAACARCRQEVASLERLRRHVQAQETLPPMELGLKRLLRDVRAERGRRTSSWWRGAAAAAVLVAVLQAGVLASLWWQPDSGIHPLGEASSEAAVLQVRFDADATEARMRAVLQEIDAVLVDGPSAAGIYRLRLVGVQRQEEQEIDRDIARLRASGIIEHVVRE